MHDVLVVLSDLPGQGHPLGDQLLPFLRAYLPGRVQVLRLEELLSGPRVEIDLLFLALPSSFSAAHAARVKWRKLVLFDYFDEPEPEWRHSDEHFLRSLSDCYLKTHQLEGKDYGFTLGTLPVPFSPKVGVEHDRWRAGAPWRRLGAMLGRQERPWDLTLMGAVTYLVEAEQGAGPRRYHQRVEWSREVRARKEWRFWGGLLELPYCGLGDLEAECGPVADLMWQGPRLPFRTFFRRMARTKVSLTPAGHARWTYRHLESVYAGCEVVSNDLSGTRTLIPLPMHCFETVPDHAPVAPLVERILGQWEELAPRREAALEHFEQYLYHGRYDARRPLLLDTFLAQVEG